MTEYLCETCKRNKGLSLHHRYIDSYGTERSVTNVAYVNCSVSAVRCGCARWR